MTILISFDIDGTLEMGDPPGPLTMDMVRIVRGKEGFIIGSCSDRTRTGQRSLWDENNITVDFVYPKPLPADIKSKFKADAYYHIGDREDLDRQMALRVGFDFLWPDEAAAKEWFDAEA